MVLCLFVDYHSRSGQDRDVSFFRVPVIDKNHGEEAEELSTKRRTKWIAAINRDDLTEQILKTTVFVVTILSPVVQQVTAGFATCRVRYVRVRYMFSTA